MYGDGYNNTGCAVCGVRFTRLCAGDLQPAFNADEPIEQTAVAAYACEVKCTAVKYMQHCCMHWIDVDSPLLQRWKSAVGVVICFPVLFIGFFKLKPTAAVLQSFTLKILM